MVIFHSYVSLPEGIWDGTNRYLMCWPCLTYIKGAIPSPLSLDTPRAKQWFGMV